MEREASPAFSIVVDSGDADGNSPAAEVLEIQIPIPSLAAAPARDIAMSEHGDAMPMSTPAAPTSADGDSSLLSTHDAPAAARHRSQQQSRSRAPPDLPQLCVSSTLVSPPMTSLAPSSSAAQAPPVEQSLSMHSRKRVEGGQGRRARDAANTPQQLPQTTGDAFGSPLARETSRGGAMDAPADAGAYEASGSGSSGDDDSSFGFPEDPASADAELAAEPEDGESPITLRIFLRTAFAIVAFLFALAGVAGMVAGMLAVRDAERDVDEALHRCLGSVAESREEVVRSRGTAFLQALGGALQATLIDLSLQPVRRAAVAHAAALEPTVLLDASSSGGFLDAVPPPIVGLTRDIARSLAYFSQPASVAVVELTSRGGLPGLVLAMVMHRNDSLCSWPAPAVLFSADCFVAHVRVANRTADEVLWSGTLELGGGFDDVRFASEPGECPRKTCAAWFDESMKVTLGEAPDGSTDVAALYAAAITIKSDAVGLRTADIVGTDAWEVRTAAFVTSERLIRACLSSTSPLPTTRLSVAIALPGSVIVGATVGAEGEDPQLLLASTATSAAGEHLALDEEESRTFVTAIRNWERRNATDFSSGWFSDASLFPASGAGFAEYRRVTLEIPHINGNGPGGATSFVLTTPLAIAHTMDLHHVDAPRRLATATAEEAIAAARQRAILTVSLLAVMLVCGSAALLAVLWRISADMAESIDGLTANLRCVHSMRLEDATPFADDPASAVVPLHCAPPRAFSVFKDIREAQEASNEMIESLRNYRKYLPDTLFPYHSTGDADDLAPELLNAIEPLGHGAFSAHSKSAHTSHSCSLRSSPRAIDSAVVSRHPSGISTNVMAGNGVDAPASPPPPPLHVASPPSTPSSASLGLQKHGSRPGLGMGAKVSSGKQLLGSQPSFGTSAGPVSRRPSDFSGFQHSHRAGERERERGMGALSGGFGLRRHRATVLAVTFVGFLRFSQESLSEAHAISQTFLQIALAVIDRNSGVVLHVSADRVVATWNAFKSEPNHEVHGAVCAHEISRTLQAADEEFLLPDLQVAIAVACGTLAAGYSGTFTERSSVAQGPPLRLAEELLSLFVGLNIRCGVTKAVASHLPNGLWGLPVDVITETDTQRTEVHELRAGEPTPWYEAFCAGFDCFIAGDYGAAEAHLSDVVRRSAAAGAPDPQAVRLLKLSILFAQLSVPYIRTLPAWQRFDADADTNDTLVESPSNKRKYRSEKRKSAMADEQLRQELMSLRANPGATLRTRDRLLDVGGQLGGESPAACSVGHDATLRSARRRQPSSAAALGLPPMLPRQSSQQQLQLPTPTDAGVCLAIPTSAASAAALPGPPSAPSPSQAQPVSPPSPRSPVLEKKLSSGLQRRSRVWIAGSTSVSITSLNSADAGVIAGAPQGLLRGGSSRTSSSSLRSGAGPSDAATTAEAPTANTAGAGSATSSPSSSPAVPPAAPPPPPAGVVEFRDRRDMAFRMSDHVLGRGAVGEVVMGMTEAGALVAIKAVPLPSTANPKRGAGAGAAGGAAALNGIQLRRLKRKGLHVGQDLERDADNLLNEVTVMSRLRHENIVGYLSSAIVEGKLLVVMELISGGSLHSMLREFKVVPPATARRYLRDTLRGLAFLHSEGILHRDLKPHNVLLTIDGSCKLTDFGTCVFMNKIAGVGAALDGTPQYMAPEAARSQAEKASDIWSFGIFAAELLTGELPWPDDEGGFVPLRFLYKLAHDEAMVPAISPHIPAEAEDVVRLCLQRDPAARPTAAELLEMPFFAHAALATPMRSSTSRARQKHSSERRAAGTTRSSVGSRSPMVRSRSRLSATGLHSYSAFALDEEGASASADASHSDTEVLEARPAGDDGEQLVIALPANVHAASESATGVSAPLM